jgi:hypothetical protein
VFHLRKRTDNAITTAAAIPELRRISTQTAQNKLRQRGIRPKSPYVGPVLTHAHRRTRVRQLRWCHALRVWNKLYISINSNSFAFRLFILQ